MIIYSFLVITIIVLTILSYTVFGNFRNPIIAINLVYLSWQLLGWLGLFDQYRPSFLSSSIILCYLVIINFGIIIGNSITIKNRYRFERNSIWVLFEVFRWICLIIGIILSIRILYLIITGAIDYTQIRAISYSTRTNSLDYKTIYLNGFIYYLFQYLFRGFVFFDLSYSVALFIHDKTPINWMTIINFGLFIIIMQSRFEFLKIVVFIILLLSFSTFSLNTEQLKIVKRVSLLLFGIIAFTASLRTVTGGNVILNTLTSWIVDFSGSNYAFSLFYLDFQNGMSLSSSPAIFDYLGGIGLFMELLTSKMGFSYSHDNVNAYITHAIDIGSSDHYNAFYTMFFTFLDSGGYLGTVIICLLLGLLVGTSFKMRNNNLKSLYIACYFCYIVVMGTYNYMFSGFYSLMIVFCIIIVDIDNYKISFRSLE